ncbi:uncharacterized protein [Chelonus insularis]|uniref:uncharacterized protein isoform X2 n=1 Tax=Chelonus insularis TaxID=460826 RepID=UPI00158CA68E|nr:uncharacterized protein LOC118065105 isoform X2 [Chelonus insularis]
MFEYSLDVIAEYKPWPRSLKKPPAYLLYIYEMLVASLVANLTTRVIWMPLLNSTWYLTQESSEWLKWANSAMGLNNKSPIIQFANYMAKEDAACHVTLCISILSFLWMMDATESLDTLLDYMTM